MCRTSTKEPTSFRSFPFSTRPTSYVESLRALSATSRIPPHSGRARAQRVVNREPRERRDVLLRNRMRRPRPTGNTSGPTQSQTLKETLLLDFLKGREES